jgi:adenine deaminase
MSGQQSQSLFVGAELAPSVAELMHLREVATGRAVPDLIVRGGKVLALHTGEILERDVVIAGRHIAAVTPLGRFAAKTILDAKGQYVAPNFIDVHIHIEYTMLTPGELARLTVRRGTTTVLADGNCIANVLGAEGLDIVGRTDTPLRIFRQVSHRVPRTPALELGGAQVADAEIEARVQWPNAATLGESNPFDLDEWSARKQVAAIRSGKRITGHSARCATSRCGAISLAASATITMQPPPRKCSSASGSAPPSRSWPAA